MSAGIFSVPARHPPWPRGRASSSAAQLPDRPRGLLRAYPRPRRFLDPGHPERRAGHALDSASWTPTRCGSLLENVHASTTWRVRSTEVPGPRGHRTRGGAPEGPTSASSPTGGSALQDARRRRGSLRRTGSRRRLIDLRTRAPRRRPPSLPSVKIVPRRWRIRSVDEGLAPAARSRRVFRRGSWRSGARSLDSPRVGRVCSEEGADPLP